MQQASTTMCNKAYGCINVKVGDEVKVASVIHNIFPDVEVHAIMMMKHKRCKGVRSYSCDVMVPGYVFFNANADAPVSKFLTITSVNRILKYDNSDWHLRGDDLFVSKWIFDNNGVIGISVAFMEGDVVRIVDGPLKQVEGKIVRINKRSRSAMVLLGFRQQAFKVWLPFEWMEKATDTNVASHSHICLNIVD